MLKPIFRQEQQVRRYKSGHFDKVRVKKQTDIYIIPIIPLAICAILRQLQEAGGFLFPVCQKQDLKIVTIYRTKYERRQNIPR